MTGLEGLTTVALVLLAGGGIWWDLRERRVPNALTGTGLLLGLTLGALGGTGAFFSALGGAVLCFLVSLPVFLVGGLGGGDVKLLAAVGSLLGLGKLPVALLAIALVGGLMAAAEVIRQGAVRRTARNISLILATFGPESFTRWKDRSSGEALTVGAANAVTIPYAVAISVGAVAAQFL